MAGPPATGAARKPAARKAPAAASPSPPPPAAPRPQFHPATGDWIPVDAPADVPPDAPRRGPAATVWNVILAIDLGLLALNFLAALFAGLVLFFTPESALADRFRDSIGAGSQRALVVGQVSTFVMMGIVPFLWVLGTRRVTWEGTRRYLHLHSPGKGVLQGIALTPVLLAAVLVLSSIYILLTKGPDGFSLTETEGENPVVDALLRHLTWPIAILISLTAGIGEEILFRGVLQRKLGIWWQAALFGLAHAAGAYLPQVLFAFGLGVFFGHLLKRGWSLVALMTAHTLYDLVLLGIGLAYR